MYALDNSSGVSVMPEIKSQVFSADEPRWFTEGGNGVSPSYPGADWFNIVQAELLNVVKASGGTPNKLELNQLTVAIQAMIDATNTANVSLKNILIGVPIPYPLSTVPAGCLAMNGQRFATRRYPKLAQKYPSGQLPDLRGEFIRGWDNGRGVDAERGVLSAQGEELKSHNHEFGIKNGDSFYQQKVEFTAKTDGIGGNGYSSIYMNKSDNGGDKQPYAGAHWVGIKPSGGKETRPRNIAFQYICLAA